MWGGGEDDDYYEDEDEDEELTPIDRSNYWNYYNDEIAEISGNIEYLGKMFNISTNMVVDGNSDDGYWRSECCVLKLDDDEKKNKNGGVNLGVGDDYVSDGTAVVGMPANSFNVSEKDITSLKFVSTVLGLNDIQTSPADLEDPHQSVRVDSIKDDERRKEFMEKERKVRDLSREPQWIHTASIYFSSDY